MNVRNEASVEPSKAFSKVLTLRNLAILGIVALVVAAGFSTKAVKIADDTTSETFDAIEYAEANYDAEIVPAIEETAVELSVVLDAIEADGAKAKEDYGHSSNPYNAFSYPVTVTAVAGEATKNSLPLTVEGLGSDVSVELMLVPGTSTALRDVTGLVNLNQFLNQVEYLHAALELNLKATDEAITPFLAENPVATLDGKTVMITGAFTDKSDGRVQLVPISIELLP